MKKLIVILPLFFLFQFSFCQTDTTSGDYFDPSNLAKAKKENGHWGINAGGFAGSMSGNNYYGSFLSPNYTYDLSQKFSVQAGFLYSSFTAPGFTTSEGYKVSPMSFNNSFVYAQGIYKVTEKVFLTGGAYTSLQNNNASNSLNPAFTNDMKGGKLGIGYNFNEHSSIYLELQLNKGGYSPFNNCGSPFSNRMNASPFMGW